MREMNGAFPDEPLVSIVIPVYNGARYLAEAIDSALAQTYGNTEVVVVNDGSGDGGATEAVAKGYGERIRYVAKENGGVSTALNAGIQVSRGEYISWLSHDDAYPPDKLERQVAFLRGLGDRSGRTIPYGSVVYMDERSEVFGSYTLPEVPPEQLHQALMCRAVFISPFRRLRFGVNGCTTLIPRRAFDEAGPFDPSLRTTQDYDMWFRLNERYDFVQMDGFLLRSRVHPEQGTRVLRDHMVSEGSGMFDRALGYHKPGSDKWDLDLPKVALASRMFSLDEAVSGKVMRMAGEADKDMEGLMYYALARSWNPALRAFYEVTENVRGLPSF